MDKKLLTPTPNEININSDLIPVNETISINFNNESGGGSVGGGSVGGGSDVKTGIPETHIYARRWWILLILCISCAQNSNNWITFIANYKETNKLYGWSKDEIDILTVYGPILFIPIALLLPYLNKMFTFRALITISTLLMCIGAIIRSYNSSLILAHIGQILGALSSPFIYCTPQKLSSVWFPKSQRTLSTSIAVSSGYAGMLISYGSIYYIHQNYHNLLIVLRLEATFSLLFFIIVLSDQIWYNDLPPIPPSISTLISLELHDNTSQSTRTFGDEMKLLFINNKNFAYFTIICGTYQGILNSWSGILSTIFGPDYLGYSELFVALIGITSLLSIIISIILFGFINDRLNKQIKPIIVVLLFLSSIFIIIFTLLVDETFDGYIIGNKNVRSICAIICCVIAMFFNAGTYGLTYEAAVEMSYPSREIFAGTILTIYFNIFGSIFIVLNNFISPKIMNWIVSLTQLICCILLIFYKQTYDRLNIDLRSKTIGNTPSNKTGKFHWVVGQLNRSIPTYTSKSITNAESFTRNPQSQFASITPHKKYFHELSDTEESI